MILRPETPSDIGAIHDLTRRAFAPMPYAGGDEQDVIDRLRARGALSLSLVAEDQGRIVGQVTLSPAAHDSGAQGWMALGPISVDPARQKSGLGAALIAAAQAWMRERGAPGCILTGNPRYYSRFGWAVSPRHAPDNEPAEFFMVLALGAEPPPGRFRFHAAFYG